MKSGSRTVVVPVPERPEVRCAFDIPPHHGTAGPPGRTGAKQSFKDECDINQIMAKFQRTGVLEHVSKYEGAYGECPSHDFREALEIVANAQEMFAELPSEVRRRFDNDPEEFLKFCENEENRDEAIKLGLLEGLEKETPEEPPQPPAEPEPPA